MRLFCCCKGTKVVDEKYLSPPTSSPPSTGFLVDTVHFFPVQENLKITTNQTGVILRANHIACRILNYLPEEIQGKNITAILAEENDHFFILSLLVFDLTTSIKDNPRMKEPFNLFDKEQHVVSGSLELSHKLNAQKKLEITFSITQKITPSEEQKTALRVSLPHDSFHLRLPGSVL